MVVGKAVASHAKIEGFSKGPGLHVETDEFGKWWRGGLYSIGFLDVRFHIFERSMLKLVL